MFDEGAPPREAEPRVIETPSGTTDPGNASSGPLAYILFLVAAALLALSLMSLASCVSTMSAIVSSGAEEDWPTAHDLERLDEILDEETDGLFPDGFDLTAHV